MFGVGILKRLGLKAVSGVAKRLGLKGIKSGAKALGKKAILEATKAGLKDKAIKAGGALALSEGEKLIRSKMKPHQKQIERFSGVAEQVAPHQVNTARGQFERLKKQGF